MGRVVVEGHDSGHGNDEFVFNEAVIANDTLRASMSYGGGCASHAFTLVIAASFMESWPVRLRAFFRHEANEDPCEAWLTETWLFDLALVRERYQTLYGSGTGEVLLQLEDAELLYEFDS